MHFAMEKYKDFIVINSCLPSYLVDLLETKEDIIFAHCKKKIVESYVTVAEEMEVSSNVTANLTGCPLEVDLNVLSVITADQSNDEIEHIPMKLDIARKFIRDYCKTNVKELTANPKHIYCLCDGNDAKCIVALGSYQSGGEIERTLIFLEDCIEETYPKDNIDTMIHKHLENVASHTAKVEMKVTCTYELYGYKLSNDFVCDDLENTGSILIEGSWNTGDYNIPQYGATIKMMLQSIIGHENSIMYPFYEELMFLKHCLGVLSEKQKNLDDAIISFNSLDVSELNKMISNVLHEVNVIRKLTTAPKNIQEAIQNTSEMSTVDKLYGVLKRCETVSDLQLCFARLFEIVGDTSVKLQVYEDDKNSIVGKIIDSVYSGKMIVHLSPKQSLELLIDLGIKKLKQRYFSMVKALDFSIGEQLKHKWSNIESFVIEAKRTTFAECDLKQGYSQLQFLFQVHISLEFLQLVEQNHRLSIEVSMYVLKHACSKYIADNISLDLATVEKKQLCELVVPLTFVNIKLIEDCSPVKWQIRMTSTQKDSSVVTAFHYSKKPIFYSILHKNYDADISGGDVTKKFFVARLESYRDKIF